MQDLLTEIHNCTLCQEQLPLGPRPVVAAHTTSKIIIIGQAPGTAVHNSGIPWDDQSGKNLRDWMGIDTTMFYDETKIGIIPMGFCYPGRGKSGDNPPTKICAPTWHDQLFNEIEKPELILLIGKYAQDYYLGKTAKKNLTETVIHYQDYLPKYFVLPHPSPRNNIWQAKNEWFKAEVLPDLKVRIKEVLSL